ncbi:MAG: hypothetical protein HW421_2039 [Ignavibacteria bacterium]|nr:hypothetical protein [Ignavibacteria bacterium]
MEKFKIIINASSLVLGLAIAAYLIGSSIERFKKEDRYISVKGFCEREVKADLVIWSMKIRVTNDDLKTGNAELEATKQKVIRFLSGKGISQREIIAMNLYVFDKETTEYRVNTGNQQRYIIEETIEVRSNNVDTVQKISRMTSELLNAGVALNTKDDWRHAGLQYIFTKLNAIKPEMLSEAIKNAKNAGEQFAKESKIKLGKLRKASQGLFSIQDRDESFTAGSEGEYASSVSDLYKKVRVVISVEYSVE